MEGEKAQEREIERLAELKSKRRAESWSERFKSIWYILFVLLVVLGFFTLLTLWIGRSTWIGVAAEGAGADGLTMLLLSFPTLIVGAVAWFFYDKHKAWKQRRLREFYEEELLESKMKSRGES